MKYSQAAVLACLGGMTVVSAIPVNTNRDDALAARDKHRSWRVGTVVSRSYGDSDDHLSRRFAISPELNRHLKASGYYSQHKKDEQAKHAGTAPPSGGAPPPADPNATSRRGLEREEELEARSKFESDDHLSRRSPLDGKLGRLGQLLTLNSQLKDQRRAGQAGATPLSGGMAPPSGGVPPPADPGAGAYRRGLDWEDELEARSQFESDDHLSRRSPLDGKLGRLGQLLTLNSQLKDQRRAKQAGATAPSGGMAPPSGGAPPSADPGAGAYRRGLDWEEELEARSQFESDDHLSRRSPLDGKLGRLGQLLTLNSQLKDQRRAGRAGATPLSGGMAAPSGGAPMPADPTAAGQAFRRGLDYDELYERSLEDDELYGRDLQGDELYERDFDDVLDTRELDELD